MIQVTDRAKDVLMQKKMDAHIQDPGIGLRVITRPTGEVALVPDRARDGDEVLVHRDSNLLIVAPDVSASVLRGRAIDCVDVGDGEAQLQLVAAGSSHTRGFDGNGDR